MRTPTVRRGEAISEKQRRDNRQGKQITKHKPYVRIKGENKTKLTSNTAMSSHVQMAPLHPYTESPLPPTHTPFKPAQSPANVQDLADEVEMTLQVREAHSGTSPPRRVATGGGWQEVRPEGGPNWTAMDFECHAKKIGPYFGGHPPNCVSWKIYVKAIFSSIYIPRYICICRENVKCT